MNDSHSGRNEDDYHGVQRPLASHVGVLQIQMKIPLTDLREAFKIVDSVEANAALESSQFVRFKREGSSLDLTLTGTLWANAKIKTTDTAKWTCFVDRRVLKAFLGTASGTDVELFYAKDQLVLKADQRLEIAAHAAISGYETWTPRVTFDLPDDQKPALRTAVKYLPKIAGTENVDAVYFGKDYGILVTDTLFIVAVTGAKWTAGFFLPAGIAAVLAEQGGKIAADKSGVGIVFSSGFAYQPLSADLDRYPIDASKAAVEDANKSPCLAKMKASDLVSIFSAASQFMFDKSAAAKITQQNGNKLGLGAGLLLTMDLPSGKFQRTIPINGTCKITGVLQWPLKNLLPWMELIVSINGTAEVEFAKLANASAFRFKDGAVTHTLIAADL